MNMIFSTIFKKYYYIIAVVVYTVSILISQYTGFLLLQQMIGVILIAVLPGHVLWKIIRRNIPISSPYSYFMSIPLSIGIFAAGLLFMSKLVYNYTPLNTTFLVFAVSFLMIITQVLFDQYRRDRSDKLKIADLIPLFVIGALVLCIWFTYRYFPGDDTYILFQSIRQSLITGNITQVALERRPLFTPLIILIYYSGRLSIFFILKYFIPLLTFLAFVPLIGMISKKINNKFFNCALGLLFLSSPYLIFSLSYSIPQSIFIILLIPSLLFSFLGLKEKRIDLLAIGFFLSFLSTGFHELGFIPLVTSLMALLIFVIRSMIKNYQLMLKYLFVALIIILPYLIIFQIPAKIASFVSVLSYASGGQANHIAFRLWYVNYYLNPDGIIFSYPGISGLLWYAYLGGLAFVLLIVALVYLLRSNKLHTVRINWIDYLPLIVFTGIFTFVAEIYPRIFYIAFLPERAWVFMLIGLWVLVVLLFNDLSSILKPGSKSINLLAWAIMIAITVSVGGSIYLNTQRAIMMSKDDNASVKYMEDNIPSDAMIVSTQTHESGPVSIANRGFIKIEAGSVSPDFNLFKDHVLKGYEQRLGDYQLSKEETIYGINGKVLNVETTKLLSNPEKIMNAEVYFVFSLARFSNTRFVGNPNYFQQNDFDHRSLYFSDEFLLNSVYHDQNVVIFKLR